MFTEVIFVLSAALLIYVFFGYPLLLAVLPQRNPPTQSQAEPPRVTLIISAFNEEAVIEEKLENALASAYPTDRLEILVVSDQSDDRTDAIVEGFAERGVRLLRMSERGGKTLGLNAAVAEATGDVIVFSDANAMYYRDAISNLVRHFENPRVGGVVGESTYVDEATSSQVQEGFYWRYETWIKLNESKTGSVVGGDGAIYAIRKPLFEPMHASDLSDFVNPLHIVRQGYLCLYDSDARSYEQAGESYEKEYRRKVRIVNRAWRALWKNRDLLNPLRYGAFALKLLSHKLLRWLAPIFMVAALASNVLLALSGEYVLLLALQAAFYLVAWAGYLLRDHERLPGLMKIPYYFCLMNIAALQGVVESFTGKTYTTWTTPRQVS